MTDLLPCPFCGSKPASAHNEEDPADGLFYVECFAPDCGFEGPSATSAEEADAKWNRRAPVVARGPWPFDPDQTCGYSGHQKIVRVLMAASDLVEWKRRYGLGMEGNAYHLLAEAVDAAMDSPTGDDVRRIRQAGAERLNEGPVKP